MADNSPPRTKRSRLNQDHRLARHLSKSASELNGRGCITDSPSGSPQRLRSAANPAVTGVLQKTHGFFSTLRHRWSRGRSKERGRKSPNDFLDQQESTDYGADCSSENSSSVTPATSPRHRATTIGGSPLAREMKSAADEIGNSNFGEHFEGGPSGLSQTALELLQAEEARRKREAKLRQHVFFSLRVNLKSGRNLAAMDKSGTSDPYVKFKLSGRLLHKSATIQRSLNPVWDETFAVPIEDPFQPIIVKVFDYDWGLQDDFMGSAKLDITLLELGQQQDLTLRLEDPSRPNRDMGEILLTATLWPRTQEDKELYFQRNPKLAEASKRLKSQIWSSVVTIVLVEGKNLPTADDGTNLTEPYIKFRLGNEKYKSKSSWSSRWLEQFDLHLFDEDQLLEVTIWNKNTMYGKCTIDLTDLPREKTHGLWQQFEDNSGEVFLLLTISGTTASETISDLTSYKDDPREREQIKQRYKWPTSFNNIRDVGHLTVKVYGATGLAAADLGGKSDPFCVLELANARLQTQTEYKTLTPNWNKIFTFNVKDMTSILEVTVFDEDRDHKVEFLGKAAIPLFRIRNGVKHRYTLKDKNLCGRAKGNNPQILLEMFVQWNPIRAGIRTLQPKEEKLVNQEAKFKRQLFLRNVTRLKAIIMDLMEAGRYVQSCFEWESPIRSIVAFNLWICISLWGDVSTVPAILLLVILKNWFIRWITGAADNNSAEEYDYGTDDDDDDDKEKEEKKTIKERLHAIQEVSQTVQNTIGYLASLSESAKNTFNFSVPELTWFAAILLFLAFFVLYLVPTRAILIIWGIVKFTRRIFRPHSVPNNELLDFLSRVPDNEQKVMYRELPVYSTPELARKDPKKKCKPS